MTAKNHRGMQGLIAWLAVAAILLLPISAFTQTRISYHSNKFKPAEDVKLGQQAAREVEQQLPILRDREAGDYLSSVGQRLVASIPPEFQHPEFNYYFKLVNASDINAFALPGGPMYVNRGTLEAARNEGELAGVMAHELSHVALRHGTAQATKAQKYSVFAGLAGIAGSILGGPGVGQLAAAPFQVYFLKYSREYETEADLLGARIMANAGYDPRDLANMFRTIERVSGGGGGGGFFRDHPNPANRYESINQEAQYLRVTNPIRNTGGFERVQSKLRGLPRAPSTAEIVNSGRRYPAEDGGYPNDGRNPNNGRNPNDGRYPNNPPAGTVGLPSSRYQTYSELGVLRVKVPDNWRELRESDSSVWFVPEGAYGQVGGQQEFTHAINFSVTPSQGQSLRIVNDQKVRDFLQRNRSMRQIGRSQ